MKYSEKLYFIYIYGIVDRGYLVIVVLNIWGYILIYIYAILIIIALQYTRKKERSNSIISKEVKWSKIFGKIIYINYMYTGIVGYLIIVVLNIRGYITIAIYKEERRTIEFDDLERSKVK